MNPPTIRTLEHLVVPRKRESTTLPFMKYAPTIAGILLGLLFILIVLLALYLLWVGRNAFARLLN